MSASQCYPQPNLQSNFLPIDYLFVSFSSILMENSPILSTVHYAAF